MNLVDSSGWLEYFADGKNADLFAPVIENSEELLVSVINIYEVYKRILVERDENAAKQAVYIMQQTKVIDVTPTIARIGAGLSFELKIPMADSLILATAKTYDAILWTQDADFKGITNVQYFPK